MKTSLDRIREDCAAFSQRVEAYRDCIANTECRKDRCEAAYEGLYKLMQRIKRELQSGTLNKDEIAICFEIRDNCFLNGLLELRKVGTLIQSDTGKKNGYMQLYIPSGQKIRMSCEVSAGSLFSANIFALGKPSSGIEKINHLDNLDTAIKIIEKILGKLPIK